MCSLAYSIPYKLHEFGFVDMDKEGFESKNLDKTAFTVALSYQSNNFRQCVANAIK